MFKVKYNNEKAVTCYNGEIPALEILRNYVQNSYKISVYRDTIIVATKDKKIVAITGMEGLFVILEPFDTVYVFKKDEITFDYNNKELMENYINNNDINIINPENNENSNIKIHRDNSPFIKDQPIPSQETAENKIEEPTPSTVNVVPTTPLSSVEPKKKSKAPLIIIILILLIGLGIAAYFLIPKTSNGNANDSNNNKQTSSNTKKEDKLKSNEVYYYDWDEDKNKIVTVPKEQKIVLVFYNSPSASERINTTYYTEQDSYLKLVGIHNNDLDKEKLVKDDDKYFFVDSVVKNGYLEIPDEVEGNKVTVIGSNNDYQHDSSLFGNEYLNEEKIETIPKITKIKIPDTVEIINPAAFSSSLLTEIEIPDSVKAIATGAFHYSPNLKKVILSKNLKKIDYSAFEYCTNLESVKTRGADKDYDIVLDATILKEISSNSFSNCSKLKSLAIINNTETNKYLTIASEKNTFNTLEEIYIEGFTDLRGVLSDDIPLKKVMLEDIENNHKMFEYGNNVAGPLKLPSDCIVEYFKLD